MPGNNTLCYEGIQRVYRNAIVGLLRARLTDAYGDQAAARLRRPFAKEWEASVAAANERRATGELSGAIADDFDLLGVNHFFNLLDAEYAVIVGDDSSLPAAQRAQNKQAILGWAKTIKALRDPLAHPATEEFSYEDAFVLLDSARRLLKKLGLVAESQRVAELRERLQGSPNVLAPEPEHLESFLPPRESVVVDFIGRSAELAALQAWFDDPLSRRWALAGDGGKGKSALAYDFATQVLASAPRPYQFVMWLSAKRRRFIDGATRAIPTPDFSDLDSALNYILTRLGWEARTSDAHGLKKQLVLELLDTFPALLVVDDIDALETLDEAALEFFTLSVPSTKTKVLLTSRRVVFGMGGSTINVRGFSLEEATDFVRSRCGLMGLDQDQFTTAVLKQLHLVTEGSPLYIEDLLRLSAVVPVKDAIAVWRGRKGDEARSYALGRELDLLSAQAKEVIVAACLGEHAVSLAELEALTGASSEKLWSALAELQRLYLIPKPQLVEGDYRFAVNTNIRRLVTQMFASSEITRRIVAARKTVSGQVPTALSNKIAPIVTQAVLYVRRNSFVEAEQLLLKALELHPNNRILLGHLGWVYKAWLPPRVTDARERFHRAAQLRNDDPEMYAHWSRMEADLGEWQAAIDAAMTGLKLPGQEDNAKLLQLAGYAHSRLGKVLTSSLNPERAQEEAREAVKLLQRALRGRFPHRDDRLKSNIYRSLALSLEALQEWALLRECLDSWTHELPDDSVLPAERQRLMRKARH